MTVEYIEDVEQYLKCMFLSNIHFTINNKPIKRGKLINVAVKDFFVVFQLQIQKGGIKTYEVPYPYSVYKYKDSLIFDYKLNTLGFNDPMNLLKLKNFKPKKNSKFYDIVMSIEKTI